MTYVNTLRTILAGLGLSLLMCGNGLREDELDCERAVAHLQDCCPGFTSRATVQCEYSDGCARSELDLSIGDSECILAQGCSALVASGVCERVETMGSSTGGDAPDAAPVETEVCP